MPNLFKKKTGRSSMTSLLAAIGLKQMATDADPEELMDAINAMADEAGDPKGEETKDEDPAIQALSAKIDQLAAVVAKLTQGAADQEPEDKIDAAIAELEQPSKDDDEEESHTIPAENFDDEGPVSSEEDRPKSAMTGDNAYKIQALKAMKPIIAAISDPAERKRAADAAIASIKGKPTKPNVYGAIKPKKPATDTKMATADHSQLGKEIAQKYNPHYMKRA